MVTDAVPLMPSLIAVMVTGPPARMAVTRPVVETMASVVLPELQVTGRPVRTVPPASFVAASSWVVAPASSVALAGVTVTWATGIAVTVMVVEPVTPWVVAVIVIGPPAVTPFTRPFAETVATAGLPELQETDCPLTAAPFASRGVAVSCTECPTSID